MGEEVRRTGRNRGRENHNQDTFYQKKKTLLSIKEKNIERKKRKKERKGNFVSRRIPFLSFSWALGSSLC